MGLRVDIFRSDYRSTLNLFDGVDCLTITNAEGPFAPAPNAPAALLVSGAFGEPIIVPSEIPANMAGPMFGGSYAATSDSRFGAAMKAVTGKSIYGALPIHDRVEDWATYRSMSD
jgi:hypothetical protein